MPVQTRYVVMPRTKAIDSIPQAKNVPWNTASMNDLFAFMYVLSLA
jgi:hypothetical protein